MLEATCKISLHILICLHIGIYRVSQFVSFRMERIKNKAEKTIIDIIILPAKFKLTSYSFIN